MDIAKEVAKEKVTILAGGVTQTEAYRLEDRDKEAVKQELWKALKVLVDNKVDLIILEVQRNPGQLFLFHTTTST